MTEWLEWIAGASLLDWLISVLLLTGSAFALVGSIGLVKLRDFYLRLHGPTKATTLGVGAVLTASSLHFSRLSGFPSLHELMVLVFLFITAPVSAQLLIKSSLANDTAAPPPPRDPKDATPESPVQLGKAE